LQVLCCISQSNDHLSSSNTRLYTCCVCHTGQLEPRSLCRDMLLARCVVYVHLFDHLHRQLSAPASSDWHLCTAHAYHQSITGIHCSLQLIMPPPLILIFPCLSVLDLGPMYATDRQTSHVRRAASLNAPPIRGAGITSVREAAS